MKISKALDLKGREIVSFVGGGGKTTLMFCLAEEIPLQKKVVITTTTKIFLPPPDKFPLLLLGEEEKIEKDLAVYLQSGLKPVIASGMLENNKINGITSRQLSLLKEYADFILVEADGSKGFSLKGHLDYEPVVSELTTVLVVVIGADIIGKNLDGKHVHRPEVVSERTGREMGSIIDSELIAQLITHPEELLRGSPPCARVVPFINKVDRLNNLGEVYRLGRLLLRKNIRKVLLGSAIGENPVLDILEC